VDQTGAYVATLQVSDGELWSDSALHEITVNANAKPVAEPGDDQQVPVGQEVCLDASNCHDPCGENSMTYNWSMLKRPEQSSAQLDDNSAQTPCFMADQAGQYVVQLIVNDGEVDSVPETVLVTADSAYPADVVIDIKPFSPLNRINTCSRGATEAMIWGSETFDVSTIDIGQLNLAGAEAVSLGSRRVRWLCSSRDMGSPDPDAWNNKGPRDGYRDLTCLFTTRHMTDIEETSETAEMSIIGCDDPEGGCQAGDDGYYSIVAEDWVDVGWLLSRAKT
jgi:hypothetical protein